MHTQLWLQNLKKRDHSAYLGRQKDNIRMNLRERGWEGLDRDQ
jgi:hypothetical protein